MQNMYHSFTLGSFPTFFLVNIVFSIIFLIFGIVLLKKGNDKKSKILPIVLMVIGIGGILSAVPFLSMLLSVGTKSAASISIIGGADGPTSVFLAGKVGSSYGIMLLGFLLMLFGSFIRFTKKIPFLKKYDGVKDIPLYCTIMGNGIMVIGIFFVVGQALHLDLVLMILVTLAIAIYTLVKSRKAMS